MVAKICISLSGKDVGEIADKLQGVRDKVDLVEIRIDSMAKPDVSACINNISYPLLFTNRPEWEGGLFKGSESKRIKPLITALEMGADFVDIELRAEKDIRNEVIAAARGAKSKVIMSWHDFQETPPEDELTEILLKMKNNRADMAKIVTTAHCELDALKVLNLQRKANEIDIPLAAFCMGQAGQISRFATIYLNGAITYAAIDQISATAPGQLSVKQIRQLINILEQA